MNQIIGFFSMVLSVCATVVGIIMVERGEVDKATLAFVLAILTYLHAKDALKEDK